MAPLAEPGQRDYLMLLSIAHTCETVASHFWSFSYPGISGFLIEEPP